MIQFLYLSTYEDASCMRPEGLFGPIQFNLKVFIAADKYDVPSLPEQAGAKFKIRMSELSSPEDFISTVRELYEDAFDITKDMRRFAIEAAVSHASSLFNRDSKVDKKDKKADTFRKVIADIPAFGAEVMAGLLTKFDKREETFPRATAYRCHFCKININVSRACGSSVAYCPYCKEKASQFW